MSMGWITFTALTFVGFVLLHWPITALCDGLVRHVGFAAYERTVGSAVLVAGLATAGHLIYRRHGASGETWTFLLALFGLVLLAQPTLVLINIENIHFPQYALLAILMVRGGLPPEAAWLSATGLGVLDEAYQFLFMQAGRPDRLDWNDITFNAIGAALGVALLLHYGQARPRRLAHSWRLIAWILAPLSIMALIAAPPVYSPFYSVTPHGLRSHELTAGEGLVLLGSLWAGLHALMSRLCRRDTLGTRRDRREPAVT